MEWARIYSSSEHCGREGRWRGLGEGGQRGVAGTAWGLPHHVQQCSCPLLELWGALVLLQGPVPTVSDEVSSSLRAVQEEEVQQGREQVQGEQSRAEEGLMGREVVQQPEALLGDEGVLLEEAMEDEEEGDEQALVLHLHFTACVLREQVAEAPQHRAHEQLQALSTIWRGFRSQVEHNRGEGRQSPQ